MNRANNPVDTNDKVRPSFITLVNPRLIQVEAPHAHEERAADSSASATYPTRAYSSVHFGPQDANPDGRGLGHGSPRSNRRPTRKVVETATPQIYLTLHWIYQPSDAFFFLF